VHLRRLFVAALFTPLTLADAARAESPPTPTAAESTLADQESVSVTVYNNNLALVRDVRKVKLPSGLIELSFKDVSSQIDATTVRLDAPQGFSLLEQNYEFDLISPQRLLEKYVGKDVELLARDDGKEIERKKGKLLATNDGLVFQVGTQLYLNPPLEAVLPELPSDLAAKPTLKWLAKSKGGETKLTTSYLTGGLSWSADYVAVVAKDEKAIGLNGWVTLTNTAATTFNDAKLKLLAGDVHRAEQPMQYARGKVAMAAMDVAEAAPFAERELFEYHIYELGRRTTLKSNQTKQVALLEADRVGITKHFEYQTNAPFYGPYNGVNKGKVSVFMEWMNAQANGLGQPMPAGTVRVYQADTDDTLQFIGEDRIDHTPRDEKLRVKLGEAFDIVAESRQVDFKKLGRDVNEETFEVKLRNHKKLAVSIDVFAPVGGDFEITNTSHKYEKRSSGELRFTVPVGADAESVLKYTVRTRLQ
jgi:hypothetical protein